MENRIGGLWNNCGKIAKAAILGCVHFCWRGLKKKWQFWMLLQFWEHADLSLAEKSENNKKKCWKISFQVKSGPGCKNVLIKIISQQIKKFFRNFWQILANLKCNKIAKKKHLYSLLKRSSNGWHSFCLPGSCGKIVEKKKDKREKLRENHKNCGKIAEIAENCRNAGNLRMSIPPENP